MSVRALFVSLMLCGSAVALQPPVPAEAAPATAPTTLHANFTPVIVITPQGVNVMAQIEDGAIEPISPWLERSRVSALFTGEVPFESGGYRFVVRDGDGNEVDSLPASFYAPDGFSLWGEELFKSVQVLRGVGYAKPFTIGLQTCIPGEQRWRDGFFVTRGHEAMSVANLAPVTISATFVESLSPADRNAPGEEEQLMKVGGDPLPTAEIQTDEESTTGAVSWTARFALAFTNRMTAIDSPLDAPRNERNWSLYRFVLRTNDGKVLAVKDVGDPGRRSIDFTREIQILSRAGYDKELEVAVQSYNPSRSRWEDGVLVVQNGTMMKLPSRGDIVSVDRSK